MHSLSDYEQLKVDEFFALSAAGEGAYGQANFSFIAVSGPDGLELAQGHVILPVGSNVPPRREVAVRLSQRHAAYALGIH
jgi:hypothetical protein